MAGDAVVPLRVLIADEGQPDLDRLAAVVAGLGHEVVARVIDVGVIGTLTAELQPDVALIELGASSKHALALIKHVVRESECPVIALLAGDNAAYVHEAAKEGVFAYIVDSSPEELQSSIDITLKRFAEYHDLQGAFGRRAVIEQAKGILMATRGVGADDAFVTMRQHSQSGGQKLADVARAIVAAHRLVSPAGNRGRAAAGHAVPDRWRAALDAMPDELAVLDAEGNIVAVNEGWRAFSRANGGVDVGEGANYLDVCDRATATDEPLAGGVAKALREMLMGTRRDFECFYPCDAPWQHRWFWLRAVAIDPSAALGAVVTHHDVTVSYLTYQVETTAVR